MSFKKKIGLVFILIVVTAFMTMNGRILPISDSIKIYGSDNHIVVPAKIVVRNAPSAQLLIFFDRSLDLGGSGLDFLVIDFDHKMIGQPEGGRRAFINIANEFMYQKNRDADMFSVVNLSGGPFYIRYISFKDSVVKFNTYEDLKQFGDTVTVTCPQKYFSAYK